PHAGGQQRQMQGRRAGRHSYRIRRTYILGKLPLELGDTWPLTDPAAAESAEQDLLFFTPEERLRHRNSLRRCGRGHSASTTAGIGFAVSRHRMNSLRPLSSGTSARKPSILSAFSIAARRLWTLATRRGSLYSGCKDDPVSPSTRWQSSFSGVCTPVPRLKTSSVTSLCAASRFALATSST